MIHAIQCHIVIVVLTTQATQLWKSVYSALKDIFYLGEDVCHAMRHAHLVLWTSPLSGIIE